MGTPHRIEETPVYKFDQLSDEAKEKARGWYRSLDSYEWWDGVYGQAEETAGLLGISLDHKSGESPSIWFSGFCCQGDGAKFEGRYRYKAGSVAAIKKEWPKDGELQRIAKELSAVQRRHFYKLQAVCTDGGRGLHSGCMSVDVYHEEDRYRDIGDAEDDIKQLMRDFADWIYDQLEKEHYWLNSDEQVDEAITANEYEFDESGTCI